MLRLVSVDIWRRAPGGFGDGGLGFLGVGVLACLESFPDAGSMKLGEFDFLESLGDVSIGLF